MTLKTVDKEHVSRFEFELSVADARPLYFFDTDGSRAGVLWYIHRVTVEKVDPQVASHEAEELGLNDNDFRLAATTYLASLNPSNSPAAPAAPAPAPKPAAAPPPPTKPEAAAPPTGPETSVAQNVPQVPVVDSSDPTAWRPYAAIVVTGLGVPFAYWSASALPTLRGRLRASLPAPARSTKSLPNGSDV